MHFRLDANLPLATQVGDETFVLELVHTDNAHDVWLRARAENEPVVFLVAHFEDLHEARQALRRGFEVRDCPFVIALLEGVAAESPLAPYRLLPRLQEPQDVAAGPLLQLAF